MLAMIEAYADNSFVEEPNTPVKTVMDTIKEPNKNYQFKSTNFNLKIT
jgi:hypothetical protein